MKNIIFRFYNLDYNQRVVYYIIVIVLFDFMVVVKDINHGKIQF